MSRAHSVRAKLHGALLQAVERLRKKDEYGLFHAPADPAAEASNGGAAGAGDSVAPAPPLPLLSPSMILIAVSTRRVISNFKENG